MPGLLRGMARTAVIAGTASAAAGGVAHRQQQRWATSEEANNQAADQPSTNNSQDDVYTQLEKLGKLKDQGIISEDEFNAKKQQLLDL